MKRRVSPFVRVWAITTADLFYAAGFIAGSRKPWAIATALDRLERRFR